MTRKNLNRIKEQTIGYQLKSFGRLWPYLWPQSKPSYKIRTLFAIIATIAGQFIIVAAPFFLGQASDSIESPNNRIRLRCSNRKFNSISLYSPMEA